MPANMSDNKYPPSSASDSNTYLLESFSIQSELKKSHQSYFGSKEETAAVRKADWIIMPTIFMFSFLSHLDRSNIGNARVAGLQKDLYMTDRDFSIALTVTFIPYVLSEMPANLLLKRIGPNVLIPLLVTIWGLVTIMQGFVTSYHGLLLTRMFLGAAEGGIYPTSILYLSGFYRREELHCRIALFSSSAAFSGAISGLLASEITKMDGLHGIAGWKWIFIIEGAFTALFGLCSFMFFPASPEACRKLTPNEKKIITTRIRNERPQATGEHDRFNWNQVWEACRSPHVILVSFALFMTGANLYGLAYFEPSIVNSLGHAASRTQLVSVPPFAVGFVAMIVTSYLSDRFQARGLTAVLCAIVGFSGYLLFLLNPTENSRYISLFLSTSGIFSVSPTLHAWLSSNSAPHYRRAAAVALGPIAANTGGILSTWIYPSSEKPNYPTGSNLGLIFSAGIICLCTTNLFYLRIMNQKKKSAFLPLEPLTSEYGICGEDAEAWEALGDRHPHFVYAY